MSAASTMAPSTSPAGTTSQAALPVEFVESSQAGLFYRVTPTSCTCPDFTFRSVSNPAHICKHQTACGWPVRFPCGNCGERNVDAPRTYCAGCLAQLKAECERIAALPIVPSTDEQIAYSQQLMADTMADLIAQAARTERIAGYHAQLQAGESIWG